MRDALALAGLVVPMGNDYNMTVFRLQIENPILFYNFSLHYSKPHFDFSLVYQGKT